MLLGLFITITAVVFFLIYLESYYSVIFLIAIALGLVLLFVPAPSQDFFGKA